MVVLVTVVEVGPALPPVVLQVTQGGVHVVGVTGVQAGEWVVIVKLHCHVCAVKCLSQGSD